MRLIDADALPAPNTEAWDGDQGMAIVYTKEDIDAAPTIRCEECAHLTSLSCPVWPAIHRAGTPAPTWPYGCSCFQRGQS